MRPLTSTTATALPLPQSQSQSERCLLEVELGRELTRAQEGTHVHTEKIISILISLIERKNLCRFIDNFEYFSTPMYLLELLLLLLILFFFFFNSFKLILQINLAVYIINL